MKARSLVLVGALSASVALASCIDAVHDQEVAALGPEPGGSPGPEHRPGQPCLICHGGSGPGGKQFSIAGTVYLIKGQTDPAPGVSVKLTDSKNVTHSTTTNRVGNFYIAVSDWDPVPPETVELDQSTYKNAMQTHIGRDGSCAGCHFGKPGPSTPGPVYLATDPSSLPGAM